MPRPNPSGASERKRRSRKGCWPCKSRKVKCGEEHPACNNCLKTGDVCDYSIRLNWEGRRTKRPFPRATDVGSPSRQPPEQDQWFNTFPSERPPSAGSPMQRSSEQASRGAGSPEPSPVAKKRRSTCGELTFVDETPPNAGSFLAKRRLDDLQGAASIGSLRHAAPSMSPALHARHIKTESLTELNELDLGEARPSSSPFMAHMPASPALFDSPLTPAPSSYSDDILCQSHWLDSQPLGSPDSRLSVSSDFIDAHDLSYWYSLPASLLGADAAHRDGGRRFHGYDLGKWDEDVVSNDDANAISLVTPAGCEPFNWVVNSDDVARAAQGHANGGREGGYYDQAVSVLIPWELEPLPDKLRNNKMNLLYFHHFIDHTAKVLVPYHEQDSNPMSRTLPRMALYSDGLMSLLLAYSAAHRARAMQSNVPEMRMAQWAQAVFPALREGLADDQPVSNVALTMSIMLASLEIVSPGVLGHGISWRQHLKQAGELMARRLEDLNMGRFDRQHDEECLFIRSWLAHLNMLGTLSPAPRDDTAIRIHPLNIDALIKDMDEVDCIMGFSARCARLLNHVAGMAKLCDRERIGPNHQVLSGWVPRPKTVELALCLEQQLLESMKQSSRPCLHVRMGNIQMRDLAEMAATNEAFHWAGIVHLHRRVLGKDSSHADVQGPVQQIVQCLEQTRIGGNAETGLLFPMFTAGCETADKTHRANILARIKSAETSGLAQIHQARLLMEKVWESGCPWETMIKDEFIG